MDTPAPHSYSPRSATCALNLILLSAGPSPNKPTKQNTARRRRRGGKGGVAHSHIGSCNFLKWILTSASSVGTAIELTYTRMRREKIGRGGGNKMGEWRWSRGKGGVRWENDRSWRELAFFRRSNSASSSWFLFSGILASSYSSTSSVRKNTQRKVQCRFKPCLGPTGLVVTHTCDIQNSTLSIANVSVAHACDNQSCNISLIITTKPHNPWQESHSTTL